MRLYVETKRTDGSGPFTLMTNFPKKVFQGEDYEKPLDVLGKQNFSIAQVMTMNIHVCLQSVIGILLLLSSQCRQ